jgi:prepilin-type N-terminal cleavage/methylation domain-containing protein
MTRNNHGFTLIEIVVVLVLISIIAAATFTRSITSHQINLVGEADKIRNHIRYAQSMAMKQNAMWGIGCSSNQYWLFKYEKFGDQNKPLELPGVATDKISLPDLGVSMDAFTLFFDQLGIPYKTSPTVPVRPDNELIINIKTTATPVKKQTLSITPETGLIIIQ